MEHGATHEMLMSMVLAIAVGVILLAVGRRTGIPGIVLLVIGGVALGPMGAGLIQPDSLGDGLRVIVSFAIGLILFEGGLTLDLGGFRSASAIIRRLLSVGVLITWLGTAAAIHLIYGLPIGYSVIAGSLVIVTGPTVIGPLLKRIRVTERLHSVLHWEGVLIDPIGVFIALACFEWIGQEAGESAALSFGFRIAAGLGLGVAGGLAIYEVVRRDWIPEEMLDAVTLGLAILLFGATEALISEAGLLSMTVAGFLLGLRRPERLKQLRAFKAQITDLAIGTLFMLLTARLSFDQFRTFGLDGLAVVAAVLLLVRPLSVAVCSIGLDFSWRERAFLGWIAPRGIVAATMASLVALALEETGQFPDPKFVETFTYSVILSTILLHGATADPLVRLLGLRRSKPTGWLIVGAHAFARGIARFLGQEARRKVVLLDTNAQAVREATAEGLRAVKADARDTSLLERMPELREAGSLLALTDNEAMNVLVCQRWAELLGADHVHRWAPQDEVEASRAAAPGAVIWSVLPKPSLLSAELTGGDAWLVWGDAPDTDVSEGSRPLIRTAGGTVTLADGPGSAPRGGVRGDDGAAADRAGERGAPPSGPDAGPDAGLEGGPDAGGDADRAAAVNDAPVRDAANGANDANGAGENGAAGEGGREPAASGRGDVLLCLRRRADYLLRSLRSELIVRLAAADRDTVLTELVGHLATLVPGLAPEELVGELVEREETFPSALGGGVAVPHAYSRAVSTRLCAVGILEEGVDMRAPDDEPVRLVFLLLSPWGDPEGHLSTLAEIARLVVDDDVREQLVAADTPDTLLRVVADAQRGR